MEQALLDLVNIHILFRSNAKYRSTKIPLTTAERDGCRELGCHIPSNHVPPAFIARSIVSPRSSAVQLENALIRSHTAMPKSPTIFKIFDGAFGQKKPMESKMEGTGPASSKLASHLRERRKESDPGRNPSGIRIGFGYGRF